MQNDKDTYRKFPGHEKVKNIIFASEGYSWQDRKAWADRIIAWEGTRSETFEYLAVLYDSVEIAEEMMKAKSDRVKGSDNPAYQHGGKFSPFSDKFVGSATKEEVIAKAVKTKTENPHVNNTRIEHYLNKGLGLCEAIAELRERQAVGRLDKFIERYGEDEGTRRWNERQERWIKNNFNGINFSEISQELFSEIDSIIEGDTYFATKDRPEMSSYKNKEYVLKTQRSYVRPDYVCLERSKVIEFDGDYWHSESVANPIREARRDGEIRDAGFEVMHVKEADYKKNKNKVIEECLEFLRAA